MNFDTDETAVEVRITKSLHALTNDQNSTEDPPAPYLRRHLSEHAAAAGLIDRLLTDDAFLLLSDLRRLLQVADRAASTQGQERARLLRLTPQAIAAGAAERAALFSVTEALEDLGATYRQGDWNAGYRARWAAANPRYERTSLTGHREMVLALCPVTVDGQPMLASGSRDGTVRIWNPTTGQQHSVLEEQQYQYPLNVVSSVNSVCPVTVAGQPMLAASSGPTVLIWDPITGRQHTRLHGHREMVLALCPVTVDGQPMLASGSRDRTVRIWDPATGRKYTLLQGHRSAVNAVCSVTVDGQAMLATGSCDRTVRIWDPTTGQQHRRLQGHRDWVLSVCPVTMDGQPMLASSSRDRTVRIWDPATARQHSQIQVNRDWRWGASF